MTDLDTETQAERGAVGENLQGGMPRDLALVRTPSRRPAVRRESGSRFPFPIPNGWFIVAASDQVPRGAILPVFYFNRDLIIFRTEGGTACVTSAYCAHLGAHLGVGGKIRGESIECPFHGWCYDGQSGRCSHIPYSSGSRIPSQARIRTFPVIERNGMIWAWHHLEGGTPFYDVPDVPELADPEWSEPFTADFVIRTVCQEMAENNHDAVHFRFVHGTDAIPDQDVLIEGSYKRVIAMDGSFIRETFGLGLGVLRMKGVMTFFTSTTPVDDDHVHVRWTFMTPVEHGPDAPGRVADSFMAGLSQDIPIWENKRYVDRPIVIKDERTILDHRQWCRQFYSDPAKAIG